MPGQPPKSIMRSLGEFFGHIVHGARKPLGPERREARVEEERERTPDGSVILRRTTIEEMEVRRAPDAKSL